MKLVQINFRYQPPTPEAAHAAALERAEAIATVPGLHWKYWIVNPDTAEAGGIYLFDSAASAQAYIDGPIVQSIRQLPGASDFSIKLFEVNTALSNITRAPLP